MTLPAALSLLVLVTLPSQPPGATVTVRLTHKALVARCLDGAEVRSGARRWDVAAGEHSLALTAHNEPRSGVASEDPGTGVIRFTVVPAHKYEVELRAPAASYTSRVWKQGEWTPVVRDRTTDQVVSGDVQWITGGCKTGGA